MGIVYDWDSMVKAAEGEEFYVKPYVYPFAGGRKFKDKGADTTLYMPHVTDQEFTGDGSAWTTQTLVSGFSSGLITNTSTSDGVIGQNSRVTPSVGSKYYVMIDITKLAAGTVTVSYAGVTLDAVSRAGVYQVTVTATSTAGTVITLAGMAAAGDINVKAISIYRANG